MSGPDQLAPPIRWRRVDAFQVAFSEAQIQIPEPLWDAFMQDRDAPGLAGCLSIMGGDGFPLISRHQWFVSASIMLQRGYPVAVLSAHRITLAMVRSAAWNGAKIQAFKGAELDAALAFIGAPCSRWPQLREVARQLREGSPPFESELG
jgi:hypothetical protein